MTGRSMKGAASRLLKNDASATQVVFQRPARGFPYPGYRWLALLALVLSSPAWAALGKDYDSAIVYIEREQYVKAIPLLEEVISEVPASLSRIRLYGMRFAPYTPHYYLGLAHYRLGNCAEALANWANEARFSVLSGDNLSTMTSGRADCEVKFLQAGKALPVPENETRELEAALDSALREIVEAYFNGDYERVSHFDPSRLSDAAARGQAWIYRAASQYTLYVLSGDVEGNSLSEVHASLARARSAEPVPRIDRRHFPPKFLKLMDQDVSL